jgi:predicted type IV restriction endonuclease
LSGTEFELHVYRTIRRRFPQYEGWEIYEQPTLDSGGRPDFTLRGKSRTAVIDAKDKENLQPSDIDQIIEYSNELRAHWAIIYVANDTYVSDEVQQYADQERVEVARTQWRAKP